jgi:hypothetical protein
MKTRSFILVGIFVLIGYLANAISANDSNRLSYYFLQKALTTEVVKSVLKDANGNLKPVQIYQNSKACKALDAGITSVHVESLDLAEENGMVKVVIVYHIDNQIEVTSTFVSENRKDWKSEDTAIHYFANSVI